MKSTQHMIYSEQDLLDALESIERVVQQSRENVDQKNWPQLNNKLRKIDEQLRYAMRVGAALSVTESTTGAR